jgi:hypothetical protein
MEPAMIPFALERSLDDDAEAEPPLSAVFPWLSAPGIEVGIASVPSTVLVEYCVLVFEMADVDNGDDEDGAEVTPGISVIGEKPSLEAVEIRATGEVGSDPVSRITAGSDVGVAPASSMTEVGEAPGMGLVLSAAVEASSKSSTALFRIGRVEAEEIDVVVIDGDGASVGSATAQSPSCIISFLNGGPDDGTSKRAFGLVEMLGGGMFAVPNVQAEADGDNGRSTVAPTGLSTGNREGPSSAGGGSGCRVCNAVGVEGTSGGGAMAVNGTAGPSLCKLTPAVGEAWGEEAGKAGEVGDEAICSACVLTLVAAEVLLWCLGCS